jgi:hypothetical protein
MCKLKMCMCIFGKILERVVLGGWIGVYLDGLDGSI